MALANYGELTSTIAEYLNRDDLTTTIPVFIVLAEAKFNRKIRTRQMLVREKAVPIGQYIALPDGFREPKNLQFNTNPVTPLDHVSPHRMDELRPDQPASGTPLYYTVLGSEIELLPAPESTNTTPMEMTYYQDIPSLSATNTTNWLLTRHPDAYLYASLVEASPYLVDDERVAIWQSMLNGVYEQIRIEDQDSEESAETPTISGIG